MQYSNGAFGFEPFALVSNLRFFSIELFSTSFEVVLSYGTNQNTMQKLKMIKLQLRLLLRS